MGQLDLSIRLTYIVLKFEVVRTFVVALFVHTFLNNHASSKRSLYIFNANICNIACFDFINTM